MEELRLLTQYIEYVIKEHTQRNIFRIFFRERLDRINHIYNEGVDVDNLLDANRPIISFENWKKKKPKYSYITMDELLNAELTIGHIQPIYVNRGYSLAEAFYASEPIILATLAKYGFISHSFKRRQLIHSMPEVLPVDSWAKRSKRNQRRLNKRSKNYQLYNKLSLVFITLKVDKQAFI
jgi:hypothetical protein